MPSASPLWEVGTRPFQVAVLSPPAINDLGANCSDGKMSKWECSGQQSPKPQLVSWLHPTPGPEPLADWGCDLFASSPCLSPGPFFPSSMQLWEVSAPGPQRCSRRGGSIACGWSEKNTQGKGYLPTCVPPSLPQAVPLRPTPSDASEQHCGKKQTGS